MTRAHNPDDICAMCNEYSVRGAEPECAAIGMGRCHVQAENPPLSKHVAWNGKVCISFRRDLPNIAARRQYVQVQKINEKETPP